MSGQTDVQTLRQKAQEIVDRAKADPGFLQQLKDEPERTLVGVGLPERAVPDFLHEQGLQTEVTGYGQCVDYTCIISFCPSSCLTYTRICNFTVFEP